MSVPHGKARERALYTLIALGIANHTALTGTRVSVSLAALDQGAGAAVVGTLMSLYALLPMFSALAVGRWSDRIGFRPPLLMGSLGLAIGAALPCIVPGLPALFLSAAIVGLAFMTFQLSAQHATGELADASTRATNFSLLAVGYSTSGFLGPLSAGLVIDHGGFTIAFALFTALPLVSVVVLMRGRPRLPKPHREHEASRGDVRDLLAHRALRRVLAINVLLAAAWDLHTIFVPVYGARIGLSASAIGSILSAFSAATFVVRAAMPKISRRLREEQVLTIALFIAGAVYLVFPLVQAAPVLTALSFCLGLGLGGSQPMTMSLLHAHAPAGRAGEVVGLRMSLVQTSAAAVPLVFGAVGATFGVAPVLWSVGAILTGGGYYSKRSSSRKGG